MHCAKQIEAKDLMIPKVDNEDITSSSVVPMSVLQSADWQVASCR